MYERNTEDARDWCGEDFEALIKNGELSDAQLGILRQAEEELDQTSTFSRLLPCQQNSDRYLGYMNPVQSKDRLCHLWEEWKLQNPKDMHKTCLG